MKKVKLIAAMLLSSISLTSLAYEVSTEIQWKNVLLEDFTGIHCPNCPDGHIIVHDLNELHPKRIFPVAVHSGYYAVPSFGEPDYRTEEGNTIDVGLGTVNAGRPCGVLNRVYSEPGNPNVKIYSRDAWLQVCKDIMNEVAPVNLLIKSECDMATRELTVVVEGYCTGELSSTTANLSVLITQDNILGPQVGGEMGSSYVHQGMLRDYISDVWGDEITISQGEYFTKEYSCTLPEEICSPESSNGVDLVLKDINILAFVSDTNGKDIMNVTSVKPAYKNHGQAVSATITAPQLGVSEKYGFNFIEVEINNTSLETITSAEFEVEINGVSQTATWEGSVAPLTTEMAKVSYPKESLQESNQWSVTLTKVNSQEVAPSVITGTFAQPSEASAEIKVTIETDKNIVEHVWRLLDEDGNVVKVFEPKASGKKYVVKENLTLEENKTYCFEVTDVWKDGIEGGSFKLSNSDGSYIEICSTVPKVGYRTFFNTSYLSIDSAVTDVVGVNYNGVEHLLSITIPSQVRIYSAEGVELINTYGSEVSLAHLQSGLYVAVVGDDATKQVKKILVK